MPRAPEVHVESVDLSPIVLNAVTHGDRTLTATPALELHPRLDDDSGQLLVEEPSLDLYAFAATRSALIAELSEHLLFAWKTYALEPPERLTTKAQELRAALRARFREAG